MNDRPYLGFAMPVMGAMIGALLALGAVALYFHFKPDLAPVGITLDAKQASEVKRETTVPLAVTAPVQVYKPAIKAKLKLPAAVIADEETHVVASSKTANDERQHTVTTTLNTETGEFSSYDRVDPLPWLAVKTKTHISAYYGLKNLTEQTIRLQAQQEFLQTKAIHIEGTASVDLSAGKPDTFIGIGGRFSF